MNSAATAESSKPDPVHTPPQGYVGFRVPQLTQNVIIQTENSSFRHHNSPGDRRCLPKGLVHHGNVWMPSLVRQNTKHGLTRNNEGGVTASQHHPQGRGKRNGEQKTNYLLLKDEEFQCC